MATLNEYFHTEARDFLSSLERSLQRAPAPDAAELHQAVRGLRGTAQMAREQRIFDVVSAFESVTRTISAGALTWSDNIAARARDTIDDLRVLLDATEDDEQLDARVNDAAARWREADPDPAPPAAAPVVDPDTREFREFAAKEAAGIADALDHGVTDLQADPMNREPLTAILRRQRALLGAARLEEIPVIADILRAVEELTRVIVKLDVGVKQEWLDIYRVARDALQTTIAPLLRDELPQSSNSVSRLRHMRAELLERYGSAVESPPPVEDPFARTSSPPAASATPPPAATAPAAPFMAPARSTPPSTPAPATPRPGPWQPVAPPSPPEPSTSQPPASQPSAWQPAGSPWSAPPPTDGAGGGATDMLELDEQSAIDEPEPEFLDLTGDSIVDEDGAVLDLGEDSIVDDVGGVLDLSDEAVAAADDETAVAADEEAAVAADDYYAVVAHEDGGAGFDAAGVLDLGEDSVVTEDAVTSAAEEPGEFAEAGVLELGEDSVADEAADIHDEPGMATGIRETAAPDPQEVLAHAHELRDIIARATSHDPIARAAVDELYDLIRIALG